MTIEEKQIVVAKRVAEGGWSSILSIVEELSELQLSYWLNEEEEEDE